MSFQFGSTISQICVFGSCLSGLALQAVASAIAKLTLAMDNPVIIDTSQTTSRSSFHTVSIMRTP